MNILFLLSNCLLFNHIHKDSRKQAFNLKSPSSPKIKFFKKAPKIIPALDIFYYNIIYIYIS